MEHGFAVLMRAAWITLMDATGLTDVGVTAVFARALAEDGIACNVIAGARHDHLFVPVELADRALAALTGLR